MGGRPRRPVRPLIVQAMEAECAPVRDALSIGGPGQQLHPAFPARLWERGDVAIAVNGVDPRFGVDSIGGQPAVTTTLHAIESARPDLVISAGTAGGFAAKGAEIGSVYLADRCVFHDRRIAIAGFDRYGVGDYPMAELHETVGKLGFDRGTVSTGNALDAPAVDLATMAATAVVAKDMEAASVAWVCERMEVPFAALKVVTDLIDGPEPTAQQFTRNLKAATEMLATSVAALVGLAISEL